MSFFLATALAGTQLYHGTSSPDPVKGTEWLAFEPEHALIFAHPRGPPGRGHLPGHEHPPPKLEEWDKIPEQFPHERLHDFDPSMSSPPRSYGPPPPPHPHNNAQHPLSEDDSGPKNGYLHTYALKHPLNLLYIDGMSAGKTANGTLDTQDILLLNLTAPDHGFWGEIERARGLCDLAYSTWQGKIDGIVRMEGGFEIILCEFAKHLEVKEIMPVVEQRVGEGILGGWRYYQAITDRYHGIGGGRVRLNYENFISVFEYEGLDLWANDVHSDVPMPRLQSVSSEDLLRIKNAVTDMVLKNDKEIKDTVNWQEVTDMIIGRYSAPLHYLGTPKSPARSSKEEFATYLSNLLRPFIDHTSRNTTLETHRCIAQSLPAATTDSLAARTVLAISTKICNSLLTALDVTSLSMSRSLSESSPPPAHALSLIDQLISYLQWTAWKQCPSCADEEICVVPIWPLGTLEDHRKPRCLGESEALRRNGYWGRFGMGRRAPPDRKNGRH
ncbi:hypothetical protein K469DRAFT_610025 [Zopfia rhizophila CBS 207.26]|uniref:Uncharacterized protein n=1 Tax=Zopfia rhizophila CBS 207.26 TaxID=1314779 RepID=A0A6A6DAV3_9PEZI|nr:hypothetical protein K469DRAFT_610025 [Zopfia rhizophila CBS 207.26]